MTEKNDGIQFYTWKDARCLSRHTPFRAKISRHLQPLRGVSGCTVGPGGGGGVLEYP